MTKTNILEVENVVRTFKVIVASILTSLIVAIPFFIGAYFRSKDMLSIGMAIGLITLIGSLWVFGYLIKRIWGWK